MSHFAKIDSNNVITEVIVAEKDFINSGNVGDEFLWVQTSYGDSFRGKYAGSGYIWDSIGAVFIPPKPHPSWLLDGNNEWQAPYTCPFVEGVDVFYGWEEATTSWVEITLDV